MKRFLFIPLLITFFLIFNPVFAVTTPSFPACTNPQGTLKVSYSTGTHGIVGSTASYTGSDSVYTLTDTTLTQCFCADNGSGIQTNWWKVSSLTDAEVRILKNQGWYYVPTGVVWGLADTPYMAYNSSYSCKAGFGGGEVLGLATTGNSRLLYGLLGISLFSLLGGLYLRRHAQ